MRKEEGNKTLGLDPSLQWWCLLFSTGGARASHVVGENYLRAPGVAGLLYGVQLIFQIENDTISNVSGKTFNDYFIFLVKILFGS